MQQRMRQIPSFLAESILHRKDRTTLWVAGIFLIAAYLSLVNLGGTPLWHDEATPAYMGDNLWRNQTLSAWNGRTLYVGNNGTAVNSDLLLASFPPWPAFPSALGIALFGKTELGVRLFHTLLGLAALLLFWKLLCLDFRTQPRLRVLAFALFALSTQVLLYLRTGRYVADAFFFTFLSFYAYRLYIGSGGRRRHLALAAAATVLNFLNHFSIGAAFALTLAAWHLIYHFKHTSARQWRELLLAALVTAALCFAYLVGVGILFGDAVLEFSDANYKLPLLQRKVVLVFHNFRELLLFGILPLWVALWFIGLIGLQLYRAYRKRQNANAGNAAAAKNAAPSYTNLMRWGMLMVLFLAFSGLLSVRPPTSHILANARYIAPVFACTALITAALIDCMWRQPWLGKICALPMLLVALSSNALAYPFIFPNLFTGHKFRFLLPELIAEVHTVPYRNYLTGVLENLRKHAKQDETIFVYPWQDFTMLQFYLSDKLVFCCTLDESATVSKKAVRQLGLPLYLGDVIPQWVIVDTPLPDTSGYKLIYSSKTIPYPTNRPEIEFRTFRPLMTEDFPPKDRAYLYRRKR